MKWETKYRAREFVGTSFWLFPSLALLAAWLIAKLILWFVPDPHWPRFDTAEIEGLRTSMGAFASSMLTFVVYAVSALLLIVQLASGQTTPRLIRLAFSRWQLRLSTSLFAFSFGITMVSLANLTEESRHSVLLMAAILANVASILVFFWFVQEVGLGLRPVAVLQQVCDEGKATLDSVYPLDFDTVAMAAAAPLELHGEARTVPLTRASGTFLAFGTGDLAALAARRNCTIELLVQVGDFLSSGDPLARIYPASASVDDKDVNDIVAFGPERTLRQDPLFAIRIMVDVAARALSPAVNDPTTAVLAIDQIHRMLRYAGHKNLDNSRVHDREGTLRLLFPTPNWEDIIDLATTEIRHYGATSIQVTRRMRAMLEHLIDRLPETRLPPLRRELDLLERSVARSFPEADDQQRARVGDFQGLGGSSNRVDC